MLGAGEYTPCMGVNDDYWRKTPAQPVVLVSTTGQPIVTPGSSLPVHLSGSSVAESKTEADATEDVVTFSAAVTSIEIYHSESDAQEFVVNGITLTVASGGWRSPVAGTPSATVTLPTGVTGVIVNRLV